MGISVDCPNLRNLAIQMGMNTAPPSIMSQLNVDCCNSQKITCDSNARVTHIRWDGLNPTLTGSINGSFLPPLLTEFRVSFNDLTGIIPQTWPTTLQKLYLDANYFSGNIPILWPSGLLELDISRNSLNCVSPGPWPSGLTLLHLNGLLCTGSVGLFPSTLQYLYLGWSQDTPGTYNKFSGSLVLNTQSLVELRINYNLFTNIIISDTSVLSGCDLSYNPLLGNPNIAKLTMCTQTGLYSASLLPNTILTTLKSSTVTQKTLWSITSLTSIKSTASAMSTSISSTPSLTQVTSSTVVKIKSLSTSLIYYSTRTANYINTEVIQLRRTPRSLLASNSQLAILKSTMSSTSAMIINNTIIASTSILPFKPISVIVEITVWSLIKMGIKLFIDTLIVGAVLVKTPFRSALEAKRKKILLLQL